MRLGRVCKAWSADLSGAEWVQLEPRRSARTLSPHERRSLRRGHIRRSRPLPPRPAPAFTSGAFAPLLLLASQPTCRSVDRVSMILDMLRRSRVAPSHHAPTPRSHARNASGMMQPRCVRTERSPRSFTAAAAAAAARPRCALSAPLAACWQRGSSFSSFSPACPRHGSMLAKPRPRQVSRRPTLLHLLPAGTGAMACCTCTCTCSSSRWACPVRLGPSRYRSACRPRTPPTRVPATGLPWASPL